MKKIVLNMLGAILLIIVGCSSESFMNDLKTNKGTMLNLAKLGIDRLTSDLSVDLDNLSSLFSIQTRKESITSWDKEKEMKLFEVTPVSAHDDMGLTVFDFSTGTLTDIDGNVYTTVVIGDLEWMVENLKVTHYRNGAPIPAALSNTKWSGLISGAYGVYDYTKTSGVIESEEEMKAQYGLLYNGYAVLDPQGLAPEGWRVATDDDFKALELAVGMTQVNVDKTGTRGTIARKLISTTGWPASMVGTDDFGFSALPAGSRNGSNGNFEAFYTSFGCRIWTSSVSDDDNSLLLYRNIISTGAINRDVKSMKLGYSVRCVRDGLVP